MRYKKTILKQRKWITPQQHIKLHYALITACDLLLPDNDDYENYVRDIMLNADLSIDKLEKTGLTNITPFLRYEQWILSIRTND